MSLRTKLVISFTLLLLLVIVTVGLIATRSVESILVAQIDRTLVGFMERGPISGPGAAPGATRGAQRSSSPARSPRSWWTGTGRSSIHALGIQRRSGSLPDVSDLAGQGPGLFSCPRSTDSLEYRAVIADLPDGARLVTAARSPKSTPPAPP